ncbi:GntR family transcriptional regulator [Chelativorans alearense]|uniref:GntR family transcriptional regulator n=1 Tax=Chelativorans alearense TaxID=2681495 RepID=UPI0013D33BF6|nr:GntR family transcriptional regulator [Chelativorans alearense]
MRQPNDPYAGLSSDTIRPIQTLSRIALEAIERLIADGSLKSGDRVNESQLAEILGISRGPIREAVHSLEQMGLLVSVTNKGMFVRALSLEEAQHLYELRSALAGLAGRLIAVRGTEEDISALVALVDEMDVAVSKDDAETYFRLNLDFHEKLIGAAGNPALQATYQRIVKQLLLMRRRGLVQAHNIRISNEEHRVIVNALRARNADAAETAMRVHVENGFKRIADAG